MSDFAPTSLVIACLLLSGCDQSTSAPRPTGLSPLSSQQLEEVEKDSAAYKSLMISRGDSCFTAGKNGKAVRILCGSASCFTGRLNVSFQQLSIATHTISNAGGSFGLRCVHSPKQVLVLQEEAARNEIAMSGEQVLE